MNLFQEHQSKKSAGMAGAFALAYYFQCKSLRGECLEFS